MRNLLVLLLAIVTLLSICSCSNKATSNCAFTHIRVTWNESNKQSEEKVISTIQLPNVAVNYEAGTIYFKLQPIDSLKVVAPRLLVHIQDNWGECDEKEFYLMGKDKNPLWESEGEGEPKYHMAEDGCYMAEYDISNINQIDSAYAYFHFFREEETNPNCFDSYELKIYIDVEKMRNH